MSYNILKLVKSISRSGADNLQPRFKWQSGCCGRVWGEWGEGGGGAVASAASGQRTDHHPQNNNRFLNTPQFRGTQSKGQTKFVPWCNVILNNLCKKMKKKGGSG